MKYQPHEYQTYATDFILTHPVAAILLAVGVPSYQGMTERTRINSAMHLLSAHMASARNTAISYRIPTVVCPSNLAGGCRTDGDWSHGWLMFFDPDGNRQPDLPQDILRDENAPIHPSLRIVSSAGRTQLRREPVHHRRLAAAADRDVADHDHRHREALRHDRGPPPRGECPEQAGKRPQELRDRTAPLPEGRSLGCHAQDSGMRPPCVTAPAPGWRR